MPLLQGTRRALLRKQTYIKKVLGYGPIAYWPLWEASGSVAACQVNAAQNGAYTGVTLGQPGIGDGNTAPLFDGTNDYTDIYSATFDGAFDGSEGTIALWIRVSGSGVWTDATTRFIVKIYDDSSNLIYIRRQPVNNQALFWYEAGGTSKSVTKDGATSTDFVHVALTWSETGDALTAYWAGSQLGSTQSGLGSWSGGGLNTTNTMIGASNTTPASVWDGYIAHVAVWDTALSAAAIADLATV